MSIQPDQVPSQMVSSDSGKWAVAVMGPSVQSILDAIAPYIQGSGGLLGLGAVKYTLQSVTLQGATYVAWLTRNA